MTSTGSFDRPASSTFHAVTVVWGREYLDLFLNTSLPTQFGTGNVEALPQGSRYRILTHGKHVDEVRAHPRVQALSRMMAVDVVATSVLEALDHPDSPHRTDSGWLMTACHREAIQEAVRSGAALLFLAPDLVLSTNTFASVARRHRAGYRAVVCAGLRLERESFVAALAEAGCAGEAVPPRELVRIALRHLHSETRSMMFDARAFSANPRAVYWRIGDDGLLARCFEFHPLMVDPMNGRFMPKSTVDADYVGHACPDITRVHAVTDSDEFVVFELTESGRTFKCFTGAGITRRQAITAAARTDDFGIEYWRRHPVRLHGADFDSRWTATEAAAELFAQGVLSWARPFGLQSAVWYQCLKRTWHLQKRFRQTWRRVPRLPLKRIRRSMRTVQGRASKAIRKTTRRFV